ncbi:M3 family metallopeptidase [Archangium violaceum]|uniref:M3 family metallopeptidase n=1 Tax=Archangium violaceum TaxID=83451 RepID=UPI00194F7D24|nr:M3 family metallopeptidase [Archangium violaceum]QRN95744.1 M3 family metallopeptidase [Archangium violaceum]
MTASTSDNPLLQNEALPKFDRIRSEHVEPAIRELLTRLHTDLDALERDVRPTWEQTVARLSAITEPIGLAWGVVNHLMGVQNSPELRQAHAAVEGEVVEAFMRIGQSEPLYKALKALREGPEWKKLDDAQHRIVESSIRDAELSGVGLQGEARARFQEIERELAELSTRFANNVIDANKAWSMTLTKPEEVEGLPPSALAAAAQAARQGLAEGAPEPTPEKGPWRITLEAPSYVPFLEHSRRPDLREKLYRAFVTRASSGDTDNNPLIERVLTLRREKSRLLGHGSFAEVSLAAKMAPGVQAVEQLLGELRKAARARARDEHTELTEYARRKTGNASLELKLWDVPFWAERLREERYAYTDEELRPYFAMPRVLEGLFDTAKRLFGVTVRAADGEAPVWDPSVRFFRVADESGKDIAAFYLDPYSRPATKRGGAWMNGAIDRKRKPDGSLRLPVAYLVCNATPPVGNKPALLTFREMETLFHEFGHGLQHMLTRVDYPEAAGINNVEWDAVELPSQFMENWCFHEETLSRLARHVDTGAPLPKALQDKIRAGRIYRAATQTLRQVYFATLDLELHHRYPAGDDDAPSVLDVQLRIAADNTVLKPLSEDRFLCGFTHIFAGGYAAGYYSYKWAEVLSADAFSAFEEAGLSDAQAVANTGRRFRDTVLALGGSRHPLEVFQSFRGRAPSTHPLLKQTGLLETQELETTAPMM